MSPGDLAERAGMSASRVKRYLRGETVPRLATLERLLAALGADSGELRSVSARRGAGGEQEGPAVDRERLAREASSTSLSHEELRALMKQLAAKALAQLDRHRRPDTDGGNGKGTDDRGTLR